MKTLERLIEGAALGLALAGGAVLIALTVLTLASITGRAAAWLGLGPVPGDFELVETGTAFAVFAFLPWCQLRRGHVTVDLVLAPAGATVNRVAELVANLLMTGAAGVLFWRLLAGMADKARYGETSFILAIPAWIGFAAASLGAGLFVAASAVTVLRSLAALAGRREDTGEPGRGG